MFITGYREIEADEEKGTEAHAEISGWVFNFKGDPLPVSFKVRNERGMNYFAGLELNEHNPTFTLVRGVLSSTTRIYRKEIESAWGETEVEEKPFTSKEWVITSSSPETYPLDDAEKGIVPEDVQNLKAARAKTIAELKARQEAYEASKNSQEGSFGGAATVAAPKKQAYNF